MRCVRVVYAASLLGASAITFDAAGLWPGIYVLLLWSVVLYSPTSVRLLVAITVLVIAGFHLAHRSDRAIGFPRAHCAMNLRTIAIALSQYHSQYGSYPPAYIADEVGHPKHSWRVLLLPMLDEQLLYDRYNWDEPWNGPNNRLLLDERPAVYACPSNRTTMSGAEAFTHYVVVVDANTVWPGSVGRKRNELAAPAGTKIAVVEATGPGIPWTKPQDLALTEALPILTSASPEGNDGHRTETFFLSQFHGRHVVTLDGHVILMPGGVSCDVWLKLLRIDDAARLSPKNIRPVIASSRTIKVGNCIRLSLWIVVVVLPLPWAILRRSCGLGTARDSKKTIR